MTVNKNHGPLMKRSLVMGYSTCSDFSLEIDAEGAMGVIPILGGRYRSIDSVLLHTLLLNQKDWSERGQACKEPKIRQILSS